MGIVNKLKLSYHQLAAMIIFLFTCHFQTNAQDVYVNSYALGDSYPAKNIVFKLDLASKSKSDSVILPVTGQFVDGYPFELSRNSFSALITIIQNGVPAKNAGPPKGHTDTYYCTVSQTNLSILNLDSLLFRAVVGFKKSDDNRLSIQWIDERNSNLLTQEDILELDVTNEPRTISTGQFERPDYSLNDIGHFKNPKKLLNTADTITYWDLGPSGANIYLFRHNPSTGILNQTLIGDRTEMNIVLGYNESANKIYSFITPYKMYSYSPSVYSSDTLNMTIGVYDPFTLSKIDSLTYPVGDAYAAMEIGTAESDGPYLYYYYFWQDGYGQFDPAYLLIFDTRTNEATWLRVGWR